MLSLLITKKLETQCVQICNFKVNTRQKVNISLRFPFLGKYIITFTKK